MTMRLIPNAAAVSEFIAGYNGDCGQTAELALLHVLDPARYPLDSATLGTIVRRDITDGWASSNGSEPIGAIANDLRSLGVAFTNYGYGEPFGPDWRGMLAQWGGIKPIIFEYARAGHLPGDESGVAYHFNTCLGWDPAANSGLFADGDNYVERVGGTALVTYSATDLANAGLCGMLVGEYALGKGSTMSGSSVPAGWSDDGTTLKAPNGVAVVQGMRAYVLASPGGWNPADVPVAPESYPALVEVGNPSLGGGTVQWFRISGQLSWTQANGVFRTWNGQEEQALRAALEAAQANVTAAQQQRDDALGQVTTLQQELTSAQAALQAALQAAQQTPAPTPPQAPPPSPAPTPLERAALALVDAMRAALNTPAS